MKATGKSIKEDLARCKAAYLRNEDLRAIAALASALKGFVSVKLGPLEKSEVETQFRDSFANLGKIARVLKFVPKGIPYLKGQEEKLLGYVVALARKVQEDINTETLEQTRQRKGRIDQLLVKGQKLLDDNNLLEAQRCFREAVANHVDEDGLFPLLAVKLQDKGHWKASLEYLKSAVEVSPNNTRAYDLVLTACARLKDPAPGIKVLAEARAKAGDNPLYLSALARLRAKAGQWAEARTAAEAALAAAPGNAEAQKVLAQARKNLGA